MSKMSYAEDKYREIVDTLKNIPHEDFDFLIDLFEKEQLRVNIDKIIYNLVTNIKSKSENLHYSYLAGLNEDFYFRFFYLAFDIGNYIYKIEHGQIAKDVLKMTIEKFKSSDDLDWIVKHPNFNLFTERLSRTVLTKKMLELMTMQCAYRVMDNMYNNSSISQQVHFVTFNAFPITEEKQKTVLLHTAAIDIKDKHHHDQKLIIVFDDKDLIQLKQQIEYALFVSKQIRNKNKETMEFLDTEI